MKTPQIIDKDEVASLRFPNTDVLSSTEAIQKREADLQRATSLGNLEHGKIKIIFEDSENIKAVETTVWATTDKRVILKSGNVIPIMRVHHVEFL